MRDTLIIAATVGACALVGGYVIASRLSHLVAAPAARAAPVSSAEITYSRLTADPWRRNHG